MILKVINTGMLDSNCYILGEDGEAAVIDPGADIKDIAAILDQHDLTLKYIILTHAHIDHIAEVDELRSSRGGKAVVHEDDAPLLGDSLLNGSALFGRDSVFKDADICVRDGHILQLGCTKLNIIHTPGHTPGGICIFVKDPDGIGSCIFSGDTLFRLGIGRTDLGAGDYDRLIASLRRLMELGDDIKVYPGHGSATDIGYERSFNPWL